jgi:phenylacetate-CoA ligase
MLIGMECEAHAGMHLSMENLLVELVVRDGERVRPAEPGEEGEVVVTDLHNFGAPFIRYLNGDLAVRQKPERCACGRSLERLAAVTGRANDTLHDGQGRPVSGMFFIVTFSVLAHKVREFQAIQRRDRSLDLKLVPTAAFDDSLIATILKNCGKALPGVPVRIEVVDRIPVGKNGKLRPVMVEH